MKKWITVYLESPYAGDVSDNEEYARKAYHDCLVNRGEAPFASHLNYTQPGVLNDLNHTERMAGIEAGFAIAQKLEKSVFYIDRGFSTGMRYGLTNALENNRPIEFRSFVESSDTESSDVDIRAVIEAFDLQSFFTKEEK